jgi:hypothetical protein
MRTIKFRAWDKKRNRMWTAEEMGTDELSLNPDGRGFCNPNPNDVRLTIYFDFMIPLQFTGITDKNGKEIYEGDIVSASWGWGYPPCEVDLRTAMFNDIECMISDDIEIIGNIYENPELIKKKK